MAKNGFRSLSIAAGMALALLGGSAQARDFGSIYTECGLGALIAPKTAWVAVVTNITWDLGSTAISSDLSTADSCKGGKEKVAAFVFQSVAQLETDIARGEGEHLAAVSSLAGCSATNTQVSFGNGLRSEFSQVLANPAYESGNRMEKASMLFDSVQNSATAAQCGI